MQKNITIIVLLILFGCGSDPPRRVVMMNKTVKVYSKNFHEKAENYTFKWQPPIYKNNKITKFDLKNDMLIFTPSLIFDTSIYPDAGAIFCGGGGG